MVKLLDNKECVNRYLYQNIEEQNLDQNGFLRGTWGFKDEDLILSMDNYYTFEKIKDAPFNFIFGNGGLGKSTFLLQIEKYLNKFAIKYKRVNLRELTNEKTLSERLYSFCADNSTRDNIYIILDAVDEAIDMGILNIDYIIKDAIKNCIDINSNIKTIITCRDNRVPQYLVKNLQEIYKCSSSNIYYLCVLTEQDCTDIAKSYSCKNVEDFLEKIKQYKLGCFAASPITLHPLIKMYNEKLITKNISHFDIYENLMLRLCEETSYRKNKNNNNELKNDLFPCSELLFVASKIAIELKYNKKKYITLDNNDSQGFNIARILDKKFCLNNEKEIIISKDLILATLKTKIFYKSKQNYFFSQQTYQDFLIARYVYQMKTKINDIKELFMTNNKKYHPILTESISFLAIKNKKLFNNVIKEIPERILLSSINFVDDEQRKKLFNAYLKCVGCSDINFWHSCYNRKTFHQRLYYNNVDKDIANYFKLSNNKILVTLLEFIIDNEMNKYEKEIERIIFNKKSEVFLKVMAFQAAKKCNHVKLLKKIAENISFFNKEIQEDKQNQILGSLLSILYPKRYINDDLMLTYLCEISDDAYYGRYHHFLHDILPKQINEKNVKKILVWISHNNLKGVIYQNNDSNFSQIAIKLFNSISKYLCPNLIPDIVNLYLSQKYVYKFFSKKILKEIEQDESLRRLFLNILVSSVQNVEQFKQVIYVMQNLLLYTNDLPYFLKLYIDKQTENWEILINELFSNFINNETSDDIDNIYNLVMYNSILKEKFEKFFAPVEISYKTGEPILKEFIYIKNNFYNKLKQIKQQKKDEQKIIYLNKIDINVLNILNKKKNADNIANIIQKIYIYLSIESGTSLSYPKMISFDINKYSRWCDLRKSTQCKVIDLVMEFLLNQQHPEYCNIEEYVKKCKQLYIWKTFSLLPDIKDKNIESYNKILLKWYEPIIYTLVSEENEIIIKQKIIKDLYGLDSDKVFKAIFLILINSQSNIRPYFLDSFDMIWDENFNNWFYKLIIKKQNKLSNDILLEIVKKLASKKFIPIKDFIIKEISKNQDNDNLIELLVILLYSFPKEWEFIKRTIMNLSNPLEVFKKIAYKGDYCDDNNILPSQILSELYNLIVKNYSYVNEEDPSGVYPVDILKEFVNNIPRIFIENGEEEAFIKIKKAYLSNRNIEDYKDYYSRSMKRLKYNKQLKNPLNYLKLAKLEKKCYTKKQSLLEFILGRNIIIGDNNSIIENDYNKRRN